MTLTRLDPWADDALGDGDAGVCLAISSLPQPQLLLCGCAIAETHVSWRRCGPAPLPPPLNVLSHPFPVLVPVLLYLGVAELSWH